LIDFVAESEVLLREGERLPMSTEILESSFRLYKQLERQHSKSGFTSLLACLPALLKATTSEDVTAAFARTSAKDVTAWTKEHFRTTVTSRRHAAYAEHRSAMKRATAEAAVL
jgi:ATP phosphoribosyltransferase